MQFVQGITYSKSKDESKNKTNIRILTASNISLEKTKIDLTEEKYLKENFKINKDKILKKEDIFICTSSGSIKHLGKSCFIEKNFEHAYFGGFCGVIRNTKQNIIDNKYLFAMLNTKYFENYKYLFVSQNINNLNGNNLLKFKIPLPPLEIQKQIISDIEEIEQQEEKANEVIKENEENIKNIINTLNAKNFNLLKLENLMNIVRGASPRPIQNYITKNKEGINWIKIGDVKEDDKYITSTKQRIIKKGILKSRYVSKGDFILSNSMSSGRPYILKIDGCVHDGWLIFKDIDISLNKDYLYQILISDKIQAQLINKSKGSVVNNLNIDRVKTLKIPLPPISDQQKILKQIEPLEKEIEDSKNYLAKVKEEKQNILDKYLK
ncbi:MAG: hypothetical protein GY817_00745 [bacterium]|nr:hypothetical protein [bacterium]